MFKFFKKLIAGDSSEHEVSGSNLRVQIKPVPAPKLRPRSPLPPTFRSTTPEPRANGNGRSPRNGLQNGNSHAIQLRLQSVVNGLPLELKGRVRQNEND